MKLKKILLGVWVFSLFAQMGLAQEGGVNKAKLIITLTDLQNNPLPNKTLVVTRKGKEEENEYKGKTNKKGKVTIHVPKGNSYKVIYRAVTGPVEFKSFEIPDRRGHLTYKFTARHQKRKNKIYTLENVYFDTDKATLRSSSFDALNNLLKAMQTNPDMKVEVGGHTDNRGKSEYNMKLSRKRAESVKNYLVEHGIDPERIKTKGYGESDPVATNKTEQGRQKNRRMEVKILQE